jgi:hypothetical protein
MLLLADPRWRDSLEAGRLYRYEFQVDDTWLDAQDHGCWVSRETQTPIAVEELTDLPGLIRASHAELRFVDDLSAAADYWRARPTLHTSAIRLRLIPEYQGVSGKPVQAP